MAFKQDSKIQHGCNSGAVADDIDYGPYTSDQWARLYQVLFTNDQQATQGVLRSYADEFEVSGAGVNISVKPGAGLCNGHFLIGEGAPDWTVVMTPPTAGHTRCDYVVMLENNTAGVYAPGVATMECPGSVDYGGIADQVPEYSCRLAVIKGAEDAACPPGSLSQTTALWMTPLASVEWNVTQTIDTVTDLRHYLHEYQVDELIPAVQGYDNTLGANMYLTPSGGWNCTLDNDVYIWGMYKVPPRFVRDLQIEAVVHRSAAGGNWWLQNDASYGAVGQSYATHTATFAAQAVAVAGAAVHQEVAAMSLTDAEIGDYVDLMFWRWGSNVGDTNAASMIFWGWKVTYTAAIPWS